MPTRERVKDFIDEVVTGSHVRAIERFYHVDATMQENNAPPRRGRQALMTHEQGVLNAYEVYTHPAPTCLIDGDTVAIAWTFDMTDKHGVTRRLEEVALQVWSGDQVLEERFFYSPPVTL